MSDTTTASVSTPPPGGTRLNDRLLAYYRKHDALISPGFFVFGFLFDVVTLGRIDDTFTIVQQAVYLALLTYFVALEVRDRTRPVQAIGFLEKIWQYRELITHFLFGSLLSAYTLFFFKSASLSSSFLFLVFLTVIMVINEFERFQKLGPYMRSVLLSLCVTCYLAYTIPLLLGFVGLVPFLLSIALAGGLVFGFFRMCGKLCTQPVTARLTSQTAKLANLASTPEFTPLTPGLEEDLQRSVLLPGLAVQIGFVVLYLIQAIPPVPLSAQYMGIYHQIEKSGGQYVLSYERPWWKFWQNGAQTFAARSGDRVYVFARVFAPKGFRDQIQVRWQYDDPRLGWTSADAIPLNVSGGRDDGFRGFAYKQNYVPGDWRVSLETSDGREISRIHFEIENDESQELRELSRDIF